MIQFEKDPGVREWKINSEVLGKIDNVMCKMTEMLKECSDEFNEKFDPNKPIVGCGQITYKIKSTECELITSEFIDVIKDSSSVTIGVEDEETTLIKIVFDKLYALEVKQ